MGSKISRGVAFPTQACVTCRFQVGPTNFTSGVFADRHRDRPQSMPNEPPQPPPGVCDYGDSSWLLYNIYSKVAKEEDNTIVERYLKLADGTLIFVSPHSLSSSVAIHINLETTEWFILRHHRRTADRLDPRPQAKLAGHLCILLKEHLPGSRQPERFSSINPVCFGSTIGILSTKICRLGELTLVLKLGSQSLGCR